MLFKILIFKHIFFLIILQGCFTPVSSELKYPTIKQKILEKSTSSFQIPKLPEEEPDISWLSYQTTPKFEILKIFPQNIQRRIYEVSISQDGKYATFINRWSLTQVSLETLKEIRTLNHRQLVQGGFTGIGISEDGEKIIAGASWTHKASLYNWKGESLSHFQCESNSFFVYDALVNVNNDQVLILCYDFANNRKEVRSFDQKGNLKWKKDSRSLHLNRFYHGDKFVNYEGKFFSILNKAGKQENSFIFNSKIVSVDYASEQNIFLFGNSREWGIFRIGDKKEAIINVKIEKDIFPNEEYKLNEEFKSFYKFFNSGKFILTGGQNGAILWSSKGELAQYLKGHLRNVSAVNITPSEDLAITASPDKWIVWKRVN